MKLRARRIRWRPLLMRFRAFRTWYRENLMRFRTVCIKHRALSVRCRTFCLKYWAFLMRYRAHCLIHRALLMRFRAHCVWCRALWIRLGVLSQSEVALFWSEAHPKEHLYTENERWVNKYTKRSLALSLTHTHLPSLSRSLSQHACRNTKADK